MAPNKTRIPGATATSGPSSVQPVALHRTTRDITPDVALWAIIRAAANRMSFSTYEQWMDDTFCTGATPAGSSIAFPFPGGDGYKQLKAATEYFVLNSCAVIPSTSLMSSTDFWNSVVSAFTEKFDGFDPATDLQSLWTTYLTTLSGIDVSALSTTDLDEAIPYFRLIRAKLKDEPLIPAGSSGCYGILESKLIAPCLLELIWSYWHEEGMLVQSMNAVSMRFQNRRSVAGNDPLANLALDPLRSMNNLLWGYVQDEQHRLNIPRRVYEYDHEYGLTLQGAAAPRGQSAERRSKFLEGFHHLLNLCAGFFKEDDDTTVYADGFPVLNALKDVHMQLSEGAHNQYGDLPWNARLEMMMQQWLLARPEMREFLPSRVMVAYPETWMDRVDTMKRLQGWTDVTSLHFRDLGVFGEQLLLSIRFGAWSTVFNADQAANWARFWRAEIQSYLHAYRAATGADLTVEPVDVTPPSIHLKRRLQGQRRAA